MKNYIPIIILCVTGAAFGSCSNSDEPQNKIDKLSVKEEMISNAVAEYMDYTVLPTYADMADAAITLHDLCRSLQEKHAAGILTPTDVEAAGIAWKKSRKSWELSEAFLFGPAANHNIDPHIDSWPLDKAAMDDLLEEIRHGGKSWSLDNNGGYGLIGFHSIEYMLFQLSPDGDTSMVHSTDYTPEELIYLTAVTEDLRNQAVCLEACWRGMENLSPQKQHILEEAELGYGEDYGWEMKNARQAGSRFRTFQEVAEEILQGCIDIADEVGNTKIGRPHSAASEEDKNYIESPYSLNSIEDFADNIISISNSYCGRRNDMPSISDYVQTIDSALDAKLREQIEKAIQSIRAIPEPFTKTAAGPEAAKAVEVVGEDLIIVLEEVYNLIVRS